jgi:transcriptional regulator with XRE-family HTH domain
MNEGTFYSPTVHHGHNIKRLREILGVKQDVLAAEFNITQQAVSDLEKKAQIGDEMLERIAKVLKIPIDTIKNFDDKVLEKIAKLLKIPIDGTRNLDERVAVSIIANTFNDVFHDNSSFIIGYQPTTNQIDKLADMMERLLKAEQEKNVLLEKMLAEKK